MRAELQQLQAASRTYCSILEHAPLLISTKDLNGNITSANQHFEVLDGYAENAFVGKNVFDVFPARIAEQLWRNDRRAATERRPIHEEETVLHRDKTEHIYATVKFPLYDSGGTLSGTCAVSSDITATRMAELDSMTDELTGLKNRRYLKIRFHEEMRARCCATSACSPCCWPTWTPSRATTTPTAIRAATRCWWPPRAPSTAH
ncbi:PAS domain-containing protein [Massilia sp. H-1]|nr:PAS domain-containing protein [Massilia sp. H-1]